MRGVRSHAILDARPHFSMPIFFSPPRSRSDNVREGDRVRRDRTGGGLWTCRAECGWKNRVRRLSRELIQPSDVMSNLVDGLCPGPAPTPALPPWRCPAVALPLPCPERRTPTWSENGPPRPYQQSTTTTNQPPMNQPPTTTAQSTVQSLNHCTRLPRTRTVMTNTNYLMFLFFFVSNYEVPIKTSAARAANLFFCKLYIHHYYFHLS